MASDPVNEAAFDGRPSHERLTVTFPASAVRAALEACRDTEREYRNGAVDARDATFRALFTHFAQQRAQFASALSELLGRSGAGDLGSAESPSMVNVVRRGIADLRAALEGNSDFAILGNCMKAEETALLAYERALGEVLQAPGAALLREQHGAINEALAEMVHLGRLPG